MSLTPQDIQSQQFAARFRGYDMDEVDEFLERVADEMLTLIQENKQLKERIDGLKRDLATYRDQERSFQKAIISAQQIADEMKEKSEAEARAIVEDAKQEAATILQQAHDEVTALERRLDDLRAQKTEVKEELRAMLTAYLARLDEEPTEAAPATAASETVAEEPDDDLYEKIDLPETTLPETEPEPTADEEDDAQMTFSLADITAEAEEEEEDDQALPDIDGEMLFNLDDPLDDLAPDIKIKDDQDG